MPSHKLLLPAVLLAAAALPAAAYFAVTRPLPAGSVARYVGRESCVACHTQQADSYRGSHHDLAMQVADSSSVLGSFDGRTVSEGEHQARFYRDGERFMVDLETPGEPLAAYEVEWTFGVAPLQQYMVRMPESEAAAVTPVSRQIASTATASEAGDGNAAMQEALGRIQVLRWSWDTHHKRWFHLDPPDVHGVLAPDDPLHWSGATQRWNVACAECHSTDLRKSFDAAAGRYATTFAEIDVSCEACHGPGSLHVELADRWLYSRDAKFGHGLADLKGSAEAEIQACAPCHSRRTTIAEGFAAGNSYHDHYTLSTLDDPLYFDDGQVRDEDYVFGSFIQSKMYHKGIRCSDCHDVHAATLKHEGNAVCTSCHQHPAPKYDTPAHHFHAPGTAGAACVNCHMPETTYMEVDARRDHSLRIPRPDLSVSLGTPNACTLCHLPLQIEKLPEDRKTELAGDLDRPRTQYLDWLNAARNGNAAAAKILQEVDRWADEACDRWYGEARQRPDHFATALAAARRGEADAAAKLRELLAKRGAEAPAIARATALRELAAIDPPTAAAEAAAAADDPSPLVRHAAAYAAAASPEAPRAQSVVRKLLADGSRSVRVAAADAAAMGLLGGAEVFRDAAAAAAVRELEASYLAANDSAAGHAMLGILRQRFGRPQEAVQHYEDAIRVDPGVAGPRANLADLLEGLAGGPSVAPQLAQSLQKRAASLRAEELKLLERDYALLPESDELAFKLGCAYYLSGEAERALELVSKSASLDSRDPQYAAMHVMLLERLGRLEEAADTAAAALEKIPGDPTLRALLERLPGGS